MLRFTSLNTTQVGPAEEKKETPVKSFSSSSSSRSLFLLSQVGRSLKDRHTAGVRSQSIEGEECLKWQKSQSGSETRLHLRAEESKHARKQAFGKENTQILPANARKHTRGGELNRCSEQVPADLTASSVLSGPEWPAWVGELLLVLTHQNTCTYRRN